MELQIAGTEWHLGHLRSCLKTHLGSCGATQGRGVRHSHESGNPEGSGGTQEPTFGVFRQPLTGRPATYAENARLALEAVQGLVQDLKDEIAHQVAAAHHWPGRFEVAQEKPLVLLDGAHNPAAAQALAGELQRLSGERPVANTDDAWVLVVGAGTGHDAAGILHALAPVAQRVLLTSSDPSTSTDTGGASGLAPDGLAIEQVPASSQALKRALELAGPKGRVCVAGSLHLVARAREFFNLPVSATASPKTWRWRIWSVSPKRPDDRDSSASGSRTTHAAQAVRRTASPALLAQQASLQRLRRSPTRRRQGVPNEDFAAAGLPVPDTLKLFNPLADARFDRYKTHATVAEIVEEVVARFELPLLVKKCHSSLAQGVFLERNATDLGTRLESLFANSAFWTTSRWCSNTGRAGVSGRRQPRRAVAGLSQGERGRGRRRGPQPAASSHRARRARGGRGPASANATSNRASGRRVLPRFLRHRPHPRRGRLLHHRDQSQPHVLRLQPRQRPPGLHSAIRAAAHPICPVN